MMNYQELLRTKALEICEQCAAQGLPKPTFMLIKQSYLVNFTWFHEGKKHILSLYYKPTRQSWTLSPKSDWLKNVVIPVVEPLCASPAASPKETPASSTNNPSALPNIKAQAYFEDARSCLELLRPFATDNVDCSLICQLTRRAVECILSDPACSSLDQVALAACINLPDSPDFFIAKEYLNRCLTLCRISSAAR